MASIVEEMVFESKTSLAARGAVEGKTAVLTASLDFVEKVAAAIMKAISQPKDGMSYQTRHKIDITQQCAVQCMTGGCCSCLFTGAT